METMISFVVPIYNEEECILDLVRNIVEVVQKYSICSRYEIIVVDDGSTDRSWIKITEASTEFSEVVNAIRFRRNLGKALALQAGFDLAQGDVIFTMDGDLQDDPKEIPKFIDKINEGYDLVSGWKKRRNDPVSKTFPSKIFNWVTSKVTGVKLQDFNCGYKAYRKEVVKSIRLYGELHRYIPVLAFDLGYKITEIVVEHHPRLRGISKYGWERYLRGFIDLLTVLAITKWLAKPGHLLGGLGVLLGLVGASAITYLVVIWTFLDAPIGGRPLLAFGTLAIIASLQMISLGVIAELLVRNSEINIDAYIRNKLISRESSHCEN